MEVEVGFSRISPHHRGMTEGAVGGEGETTTTTTQAEPPKKRHQLTTKTNLNCHHQLIRQGKRATRQLINS